MLVNQQPTTGVVTDVTVDIMLVNHQPTTGVVTDVTVDIMLVNHQPTTGVVSAVTSRYYAGYSTTDDRCGYRRN